MYESIRHFKTELPENIDISYLREDKFVGDHDLLVIGKSINQLIQALHEWDERVSEQGKELNSAIMTIGELSIQVMRLEKQVKELREGRAK